jgi:nucleoside-diphosphate-sugar epimerase
MRSLSDSSRSEHQTRDEKYHQCPPHAPFTSGAASRFPLAHACAAHRRDRPCRPVGASCRKSSVCVACERVGRAVAAALERAPQGRWECYVGDPRDFTFGALAALVAERLDWSWELVHVSWKEGDHPWNVRHPVVADTTRLRDVLGVIEPDPVASTVAQIEWLREHRAEAAGVSG